MKVQEISVDTGYIYISYLSEFEKYVIHSRVSVAGYQDAGPCPDQCLDQLRYGGRLTCRDNIEKHAMTFYIVSFPDSLTCSVVCYCDQSAKKTDKNVRQFSGVLSIVTNNDGSKNAKITCLENWL